MKFGKHIQSHQVPGWSAHYLDYKFLKKIISSLAANRPASEAAALALGFRPGNAYTDGQNTDVPSTDPPWFGGTEDHDRGPDFRAHKAAFFFKLERELEKINSFYLQKEAELKLRLETLLSKRRAAAWHGLPDSSTDPDANRNHVEWSAVEEGFRLLERDLGKLQQFVEVNATGFKKILKKFDKRSKSTTKELYLTRQVDVQPVFNRQLISELADTVAACLLDLTDLSSGLNFEGPGANDIFTQQLNIERTPYIGPFRDLEKNLRDAILSADHTAIADCVRYSDALAQGDAGRTNVTRILWSVIIDAPTELADLIIASLTSPFNFHFVDDINGRNCLHGAVIAGALRLANMSIDQNVGVNDVDVYGRTPLHYAAMHGHTVICKRLLELGVNINTLDIDNYSPLVYAILRGSVDCVQVLLDHGNTPVQPTTPGGDLIPLSMACQSGHCDIVQLLLQRGAKCHPNSNGEYPMHLAAREGHADICRLLLQQDGWDTSDKYHEWTPLFHAARYGHNECIAILIEARCRVVIVDELGHLPVHYAAWYGHHKSVDLLLRASARIPLSAEATLMSEISPSTGPTPLIASASTGMNIEDLDIDMIPSLSLPPPIMPHRVYGHNYLDRSHLVQVIVSPTTGGMPSVVLHHRRISAAFRDEYLLKTAPLKLVITTRSSEVNSAPYSISLPQRDEKGVFVFQIPNLSSLSLEFSIHPNFGTKTIGRAVALPSLFLNADNHQAFTLPILDNRLHVVGEITFELNVITCFSGVTLALGGELETYWKSTMASALQPTSSAPRPPTSAQTSPSAHSITGVTSQSVMMTSLRGNYLYVVVQVTRDSIPVVYGEWHLPEAKYSLGVSDVTLQQFEGLAKTVGRAVVPESVPGPHSDWAKYIEHHMMSLSQLLSIVPASLGICIELAYPSPNTGDRYALSRPKLNPFVDSVLRTVYKDGQRRRLMFTSFCQDVCSAINWKQPNYPVFFSSHCGKEDIPLSGPSPVTTDKDGTGRFCGLGSAVEYARINNLLGVFVDADLLLQVPSLIQGIKNAGLLVGIHGTSERSMPITTPIPGGADENVVDVYLSNGTVTYVDHE
ncbi:hypothetical protein CYLTODRAFT_366787 [Cylindrobasidium torrendii FP15055 ss-10]|uniref:SPX-domain-containing protein n=1 Tax=Cylindrobasidium torrendii FP15055 ss-10 TaxID=1314674 RepID=A0A0D7BTN7_9AGAR|nr:hypothetical protein CYLTODRAFT_366787 [Cylindrobasidium torrendii FP15055 ss-10]